MVRINNYEECNNSNYLFNLIPSFGNMWTITPIIIEDTEAVNYIGNVGFSNAIEPSYENVEIYPVIYLSADAGLSGEGSINKPYRLLE